MRKPNVFVILIFCLVCIIGGVVTYAIFRTVSLIGAEWAGGISLLVAAVFAYSIKVADQWERAVVPRLGKFRTAAKLLLSQLREGEAPAEPT